MWLSRNAPFISDLKTHRNGIGKLLCKVLVGR